MAERGVVVVVNCDGAMVRTWWCVERAGREERMGYSFVEKVYGIVGACGRCWLSCYFVGFHGGIFMIVLWFEGW